MCVYFDNNASFPTGHALIGPLICFVNFAYGPLPFLKLMWLIWFKPLGFPYVISSEQRFEVFIVHIHTDFLLIYFFLIQLLIPLTRNLKTWKMNNDIQSVLWLLFVIKPDHPSTLYTSLILFRVMGELVPISCNQLERGWIHPGQVVSPSQGNTGTCGMKREAHTAHKLLHSSCVKLFNFSVASFVHFSIWQANY